MSKESKARYKHYKKHLFKETMKSVHANRERMYKGMKPWEVPSILNSVIASERLAKREARKMVKRDKHWAKLNRMKLADIPREEWAVDPVEDGWGSEWERCDHPACDLQVVRPGKVQCSDWCMLEPLDELLSLNHPVAADAADQIEALSARVIAWKSVATMFYMSFDQDLYPTDLEAGMSVRKAIRSYEKLSSNEA